MVWEEKEEEEERGMYKKKRDVKNDSLICQLLLDPFPKVF